MTRAFISLPLVVAACGAVPDRPHVPSKAVPVYEGRSAALFDDTVDSVPYAPGSDDDATGREAMLRERTLTGDTVIRARIVTITSAGASPGTGCALELRPLETLAGGDTSSDLRLELSPVARRAMLADDASRWIGSPVLAFLRTFTRSDGAVQMHFHVMPASDEELRTVRTAVVLRAVR